MKLIIQLYCNLHHLHVEIQWGSCFTYADSPLSVRIRASCPSFWSHLCIGQLSYEFWYIKRLKIFHFIASIQNISIIKYYLSYCTLKAWFSSIWGHFWWISVQSRLYEVVGVIEWFMHVKCSFIYIFHILYHYRNKYAIIYVLKFIPLLES